MRLVEKKDVTKKINVTIGFRCDVCEGVHLGSEMPVEWHAFSHRHSQWGNDSIESWEDFDVCSPLCYINRLGQSVAEMREYYSAEIGDFNIQFAQKLFEFVIQEKR